MSLLTGDVRKLYFQYLTAAFGSALITSIYGIVDAAIVGQYHGRPDQQRWLSSRLYGIYCTGLAC